MKRIHPLPTLLTLGNFGSGFVAIMLAARALMEHKGFEIKPFSAELTPVDLMCMACGCIFLGMIFDMLDGKVARMTGSACQFGGEMDSLADVCTFCLAPAGILTLNWLRVEPETARWWSMAMGFGFIYAALGAVRLARYNVEMDTTAKDYFKGLPSPAAAGAVVSLFWFLHSGGVHETVLGWLTPAEAANTAQANLVAERLLTKGMAVYMLAMGFLMVTRVKYAHFSNKMLGGRKRFRHLIGALALLMVFFWQPEALLMLGFNGYVVYGLVTSGLAYLRERRCLPADEPQVESKSGIINLTQSAAADSSEEAAL